MKEYLLALIRGERRRLPDILVLCLLSVLEWVYRGAVALKMAFYRWGIFKRRRMGIPVISLGNLAAGGTGKTPLTILLAKKLLSEGLRPAVLIRGYRGSGSGTRVVSSGAQVILPLEDTGDEAQLLARCLSGVPVIAGKDRLQGVELAEALGAGLVLLDDGLQYLKLYRDLDVILLDAAAPWENGHLIPRGLLREGPWGLSRASLVVLSGPEILEATVFEERKREIRRFNATAPVIRAGVGPEAIQRFEAWWSDDPEVFDPAYFLTGRSVAMMTAIGRPEKFRRSLQSLGAHVSFELLRPDHHPWDLSDLMDLLKRPGFSQEIPIVTTEKDAIKLGFLRDNPIGERIVVFKVRTVIPPEDAVILDSVLKELKI